MAPTTIQYVKSQSHGAHLRAARHPAVARLTFPGRSASAWPPLAERLFTVILLGYSAGAFLPLLTANGDNPGLGQGDYLNTGIKAVLYLLAFVIAWNRRRSIAASALALKWILLPVFLAVISILWTQYPLRTATGSAVLVGTTIFGIYFGTCYTPRQQLTLLAYMYSITIIFSLIFAVVFPRLGIEAARGDLRGVFIQKNNLAENMVLAIIAYILCDACVARWIRVLGILGSLGLIIMAGSATAVVVGLILASIAILTSLLRSRHDIAVPFVLIAVLVAGFIAVNFAAGSAAALHVLNRSPDLTGRTELWQAVWQSILRRPWLGYGFNAFWVGMRGQSAVVLDAIGWRAGYAHNGYLDVLVNIGTIGLIGYAIGYLLLLRYALIYLGRSRNTLSQWPLLYLTFMLLYNCTEGDILAQNSIYWALYISCAVTILLSTVGVTPESFINGHGQHPHSNRVPRHPAPFIGNFHSRAG